LLGIGTIVYLIYYAANRDEGHYVEVHDYGAVKAARQVHHVHAASIASRGRGSAGCALSKIYRTSCALSAA